MDYLDPTARRRHLIMLFTGYVLVAIAIGLAAIILLLVVYGFGIGKNGQVIQNGLLFVSSTPTGARIYLNGTDSGKNTNMRTNLVAGSYTLQLQRAGYRNWQRQITLEGAKVLRYDYPLLIPTSLSTKVRKSYDTAPGVATVTPDNRWLLVETTPDAPTFDVFDMNNQKTAPTLLTVPADDYTAGGTQTWKVVAWASDKDHLLLQHGYGTAGAYEFVLVDRTDATKTINLNRLLGEVPSQISFINGKFDQYYLYDTKTDVLSTATQSTPSPQTLLTKVLNFAPLGSKTVLYVTPADQDKQVELRLFDGTKNYTIRELPESSIYPIAINTFQGDQYVAAASVAGNAVYVYKDPASQITDKSLAEAVPLTVLRVDQPNYLSFSFGGRIIMAENGTNFAAYDNQYEQLYRYTKPQPMDGQQIHATWLDGAHMQYVSGGKLYIFDFDGSNGQTLVPATDNQSVFYTSDYRYLYTLAPAKDNPAHRNLTITAMRIPADM